MNLQTWMNILLNRSLSQLRFKDYKQLVYGLEKRLKKHNGV